MADTTNPTNIPANTTIVSVLSPNSILISNAATGTFTGDTYSFGQTLSYTNFIALAIPSSASSTELYTALQALAAQLDTSLMEYIYNGLSGTITDIIPSVVIALTANSNYTNTLTNLSTVQNIVPGMLFSGDGVPSGATVVSTSSPAAIVLTGNTYSTTVVDTISDTSSLSIGMTVTGDGIAPGTTIQAITSTTAIALSQNATATNTAVSLSFTNNQVVVSAIVNSNDINGSFTSLSQLRLLPQIMD